MLYEFQDRGIHLFLTPKSAGSATHWWIDTKTSLAGDHPATATFFPVSMQNDHEPTSLVSKSSLETDSSVVLLGCRDGVIRRFHRHYYRDDGNNTIASHVLLGPFRLGGNDWTSGLLAEIAGVLAANSASVTWKAYTDTSAETAVDTAIADGMYAEKGTWAKSGLNFNSRPRARGTYCVVRVDSDGKKPWALERVLMLARQAGKLRVI